MHQPSAPQEGRAQNAEDERQIGPIHAEGRGHGDEGEGRADGFDQGEAAAARMGEHHLAEAANERQADQAAGTGMGGGTADIAQPDARHAHHQQGQQQQGEPQAKKAEMMSAQHPHAPGDQGHRHEDDRKSEGLEQKVGNVGAEHAHQVVRRATRGVVERRIARAVGEQRQQQNHAGRRDTHAHQFHHAASQEVASPLRQDRRLARHCGTDADHGHRPFALPTGLRRGGSAPRGWSSRHEPAPRGCSAGRC